jgi:hypothetical protein
MPDPDALLNRRDLAAAFAAAGFKVAPSTLATLACRGGGPAFMKFGRVPLYQWAAALSWARGRLTRPVHSTSELDNRAAAA